MYYKAEEFLWLYALISGILDLFPKKNLSVLNNPAIEESYISSRYGRKQRHQ